MEVLFENHYTRDIQWARDTYRYIGFGRLIAKVLHILFCVYLVAGICDAIWCDGSYWYYILLSLLWFAMNLFFCNHNALAVLRRDKEIHGKAVEVTVIFTEDALLQRQSTGAEYTVRYADIRKGFCRKRYLYLMTREKQLFIVKRDGFTVGRDAELLAFLKDKGIKIR